jgi:hypothetical protein
MSFYDAAGLVGGLLGAVLFLLGLLVALVAAFRIALVVRRPAKGRIARGIAAGGLVLAAGGAALFWAAELAPFRRSVDRAALPTAGIAVLLAVAAGWRLARSRPAAGEPERPAVGEPPLPPA